MEIASPKNAPRPDHDDERAASRQVRCARCDHEITSEDASIEVDGRHQHYFVNPHGFDFHVACFGDAPGAVPAGQTSSEFPWFSGMTWQLDCCRGCAAHIGWIFRSPRRVFHGLIADRITRE